MNAARVQPGPLEFGIWMPIPAAASHYRIEQRTVRRWVAQDRLRSVEREGIKGVLVWSEDVAELVMLQRDTPGGRLPRVASDAP